MAAMASETFAAGISVSCDPMKLTQVFYNLMDNAIKFTNEGGSIDIRLHRAEDRAYVTVRNTGAGIPATEMPHIFERFYKGKDSDDKSFGIGLALARMIITSQNGTVKAENSSPTGARFTIRFYKGTV